MNQGVFTSEVVDNFLQERGFTGSVNRVVNLSKLRERSWPNGEVKNNCFELRLERASDLHYEYLYSFAGPGVGRRTLGEALCFCVEEAEHGGYLESFERWNQENNYDYTLDLETQKLWYESSKEYYQKLLWLFGEVLYEQLAMIVMG